MPEALYPKWVHDPSGLHKSEIVADAIAEKKLLDEWAKAPGAKEAATAIAAEKKEKSDG